MSKENNNGANMDSEFTPHFKYRLAVEINEHVEREASMTDYVLGRHERDDIAYDYTVHLIDQNAADSDICFGALAEWRRRYGGPHED